MASPTQKTEKYQIYKYVEKINYSVKLMDQNKGMREVAEWLEGCSAITAVAEERKEMLKL